MKNGITNNMFFIFPECLFLLLVYTSLILPIADYTVTTLYHIIQTDEQDQLLENAQVGGSIMGNFREMANVQTLRNRRISHWVVC